MYKIEDGSISVSFQEDNGKVLVEVKDLKSGAVWGPTVPFTLHIHSILLQRTEAAASPTYKIEQGDGWIDVTETADDLFFRVAVTARFAIDNGELVVTIPTRSIEETTPEISLLDGVQVLPDLITLSKDNTGHLVLPYANGALCYPERHKATSDRFMIYGEQKRWEAMPLLPCTGAVRDANTAAILAIAEQGDCDAQCYVDVDGEGAGETSFNMRYRYTPIDPVDPIDRIVRFVLLQGEDAGFAGMGRRMHKFVMKKAGRGTIAERAEKDPELKYATTAITMKMMMGCKDIGNIDGNGTLRIFTTFEQGERQLSFMKENGIDRAYIQLTGWNIGGHDGAWPTRFPVDENFGGEAAMRKMIEHGKSLGYQMQVHDNYLDNLKRSDEFDPELCVGSLYGGPLMRGCWGGGVNYAGWPQAYSEKRLQGEMKRVKDLGISGLFYIDAMGMPLEVSYNKNHGEFRGRRACAEGIGRILKAGREVFGSAGTENGFLYTVLESDYLCSTFFCYPFDGIKDLLDQIVPMWLMAVKGHLFCNHHDTFNGAIDFGNDNSVSKRMLTMASLGLLPRNATVHTWGGWEYPIEETIEATQHEYKLMCERLSSIVTASLEDYKVISGDPNKGDHVVESRFSDGTVILADFAGQSLEINGEDYPLPNDYKKRPKIPRGTSSPLAS